VRRASLDRPEILIEEVPRADREIPLSLPDRRRPDRADYSGWPIYCRTDTPDVLVEHFCRALVSRSEPPEPRQPRERDWARSRRAGSHAVAASAAVSRNTPPKPTPNAVAPAMTRIGLGVAARAATPAADSATPGQSSPACPRRSPVFPAAQRASVAAAGWANSNGQVAPGPLG
jgi:hypothetical protein